MDLEAAISPRALDFMMAFVPLASLAGLAVVLEILVPWRARVRPDPLHWMQSAVLMVVGLFAARLILPLSIFTAGVFAESRGWGLFNRVDAPYWLALGISVMMLDLVDYLRHRLFHTWGLLWRAHRVHHSDEEITASTALRFHPFEALLTAAGHIAMVLVLGVPPAAVLVFAMIALVFDVWEHANVRTPGVVRHLEAVLITPGMHRVHHGANRENVNSNFGTIFSIWDRLCGTFRSSKALEEDTRFGLGPRSQLSFATLGDLLGDPLRRG